jgi:hypothetical protein
VEPWGWLEWPIAVLGKAGSMHPKINALGEANLKGWRGRIARPVADAVAGRTSFSAADVRAVVGLGFFVLSVYLLASTVRRALRYDELNPVD